MYDNSTRHCKKKCHSGAAVQNGKEAPHSKTQKHDTLINQELGACLPFCILPGLAWLLRTLYSYTVDCIASKNCEARVFFFFFFFFLFFFFLLSFRGEVKINVQ